MRASQLALARAETRLLERLAGLEPQLRADDASTWLEYAALASALAAIVPTTAPGAAGELLTTAQLAARLQVSPRTIRRRVKAGELTPRRSGARGRGALRWPAEAAR